MIVDSSAVIAILLDEEEGVFFNKKIVTASNRYMSVVSLVECHIVLSTKLGKQGLRYLDLFVKEAALKIVECSIVHGELARDAFERFGKGNHIAKLNFGDCFSYALAKEMELPILFKGDDFSKTDLLIA